jgi:hypothetical protein
MTPSKLPLVAALTGVMGIMCAVAFLTLVLDIHAVSADRL